MKDSGFVIRIFVVIGILAVLMVVGKDYLLHNDKEEKVNYVTEEDTYSDIQDLCSRTYKSYNITDFEYVGVCEVNTGYMSKMQLVTYYAYNRMEYCTIKYQINMYYNNSKEFVWNSTYEPSITELGRTLNDLEGEWSYSDESRDYYVKIESINNDKIVVTYSLKQIYHSRWTYDEDYKAEKVSEGINQTIKIKQYSDTALYTSINAKTTTEIAESFFSYNLEDFSMWIYLNETTLNPEGNISLKGSGLTIDGYWLQKSKFSDE